MQQQRARRQRKPINFGPGPIGAWDLLTVAAVGAAFYLPGIGYRWLGLWVYVTALAGFFVAVVRNPRLPVALYLDVGPRFLFAVAAWIVAFTVFGNEHPAAFCLTLGGVIYYDVCASVIDGKVRYVPWGSGFAWKTTERVQRPLVYWSMLTLFLSLAVFFLGGAYGWYAGWFPLYPR